MSGKMTKILLIFFISLASWLIMMPAEAHRYYYYVQQPVYYVEQPVYPVYYVHHHYHGYYCKVYSGYWRHGYWHPAQRVCWRR